MTTGLIPSLAPNPDARSLADRVNSLIRERNALRVDAVEELLCIRTPFDKAIVGSYYGDGKSQSRILTYAPESTADPDGGTVFMPLNLPGRIVHQVSGRITSKDFGVRHDGDRDYAATNAAQFQAFFNCGYANGYRMFIDPGNVEFGDDAQPYREIFCNSTGDDSPMAGSVDWVLEGASNDSVLLHVLLTVGRKGGGGTSGRLRMQNFVVRGGIDLWRLQGRSRLDNIQFYPLPVPDPDGTVVVGGQNTRTYGMRIVGCNHIYLQNMDVVGDNDENCPNAGSPFSPTNEPYQDAAVLIDGGSSGTWRNGRCSSQKVAILFQNTGAFIDSQIPGFWRLEDIHNENCTRTLIRGDDTSELLIIGNHQRGGANSWDPAYPLYSFGHAPTPHTASDITIYGCTFTTTSVAAGTKVAIDVGQVSGFSLDRSTFKSGLDISVTAGSSARDITFGTNDWGNTRLNIDPAATFAILPAGRQSPATQSNIGAAIVQTRDDFEDFAINTSRWLLKTGTSASAIAPRADTTNGIARARTGSSATGTIAVNGVQIAGNTIWKANQPKLSLEGRFSFVTTVSNVVQFFGLVPANGTLLSPFSVSSGGIVTVNGGLNDACGICFDAAKGTLMLVGVKAGVVATAVDLGVAPTVAAFDIWRIEFEAHTGSMLVYRNDALVGTVVNPITDNVVTCPYWVAHGTTSTVATFDIDYIGVQARRA